MASELFKVALKPTCSNSEVKLIDGASGHLTLFYQLQFVKRLEMPRLLIYMSTMMMAEQIITFTSHRQ